MPVYTVEFTKRAEWAVYAEDMKSAKRAAETDTSAQDAALYPINAEITVVRERDLDDETMVHAVVEGDCLLNPEDVEWFDPEEIMRKQREDAILARNYSLFEEGDL